MSDIRAGARPRNGILHEHVRSGTALRTFTCSPSRAIPEGMANREPKSHEQTDEALPAESAGTATHTDAAVPPPTLKETPMGVASMTKSARPESRTEGPAPPAPAAQKVHSTSSMRPLWIALAVATLAIGGFVGWRYRLTHQDHAGVLEKSAKHTRAIPRPSQVIADGFVSSPNATWSRIQRKVGGAAGIFPSTVGGLLAVATGVEVSAGDELDSTQAMTFALVMMNTDQPGVDAVACVHVQDARKLELRLLDPKNGHYTAKEAGGLRYLEPKVAASTPGPGPALALGTHTMLFATSREALHAAGAYLVDMSDAAPESPHAASLDFAANVIREQWLPKLSARIVAERERQRLMLADALHAHQGKAADLADPESLLTLVAKAAEDSVQGLKRIEALHVEVDVDDDTLALHADVHGVDGDDVLGDVAVGNAVTEWTHNALPSDASCILFSSERERTEQAIKQLDSARAVLGTRLSTEEWTALATAYAGWQRARGDSLMLAFDLPKGRRDGGLLTLRTAAPTKTATAVLDVALASKFAKATVGVTAASKPLDKLSEDWADVGIRTVRTKLAADSPKQLHGAGPTLLWQLGSGDAHGSGWIWLTRVTAPKSGNSEVPMTLPAILLGARDLPTDEGGELGIKESVRGACRMQVLSGRGANDGNPPPPVVIAYGKHGKDAWGMLRSPIVALRALVDRAASL